LIENPPPRDLSSRLRKTEHLLWWSKGRGSTVDTTWIVSLIVFILIAAVIMVIAGRSDQLVPVLVLLSFPSAISTLWRLLIDARLHVYGLTNERLLVLKNYPVFFDDSLSHDGGYGRTIRMLRITGNPARGNLRLQPEFSWRELWSGAGVRLTGIEDPLKIAALIQSTLNLPIEIEDKTK